MVARGSIIFKKIGNMSQYKQFFFQSQDRICGPEFAGNAGETCKERLDLA
jgi:hypothetical protein